MQLRQQLASAQEDAARYMVERDRLRDQVENLETDKANLQDNLNAALSVLAFSPRASQGTELSTPFKAPRPTTTTWPASPSKHPLYGE